MAQIGVRTLRTQTEEDRDRALHLFAAAIATSKAGLSTPLRALHPVDHAGAARFRRSVTAHSDARIGQQLLDSVQCVPLLCLPLPSNALSSPPGNRKSS